MVAVAEREDTGFGRRLRAVRESKGVTTAELAELVGMLPPAISRLEAGGRTPNWATVIALADALDCTPNDFLPLDPPEDDDPPAGPDRAMGKRK